MKLNQNLNKSELNSKEAFRVSIVSLMSNIILSVVKLIVGVVAHSGAMISDAVHSMSDVLGTLIVMAGIKISSIKADEGHQYGHERFESVASILLFVILLITGVGIGIDGIKKIIDGSYKAHIPGLTALIISIVVIVVKEGMYGYTRRIALRVRSDALMAEAWHHRSDSLSSIGAFVGIFGARLGFPVLDSVASVGICILIIKVSIDIFREAIDKMVDKSCDASIVSDMEEIIKKQEGVLGIDWIKTRVFGAKIYVDIEISADSSLTLMEAHKIAEKVHSEIELHFCDVKHCMVHVNPVNLDEKD